MRSDSEKAGKVVAFFCLFCNTIFDTKQIGGQKYQVTY